jgi:replicative DNA helicase
MMFKRFFKLFGGVNELEVKVEALLQEVALLREDHRELSVKVADHYEEEAEIDYKSIADNISYSQLAHTIDIFDLVRKIHVDYEDLASSIDMSELANLINCNELANHMDIVEVADNISLNDLAENISVGDIVDSIQEDIADKVFEKFLEKIKSID